MGIIVITGASSEIGLAIARRLSTLGKPMLLHCNSHPERLEGINAEVIRADFSVREDIERFAAALHDTEILVQAAAFTQTGLLPQLEQDSIDRMLSVNVSAPTRICQAVIPQMCLKRRGIIVNISSVTASRVFRGQTVYGGTKAYIETLTKGIAAEYAKKGIRCNCIAPGSIDGGSLRQLIIQTGSDMLRDINASGRFGSSEEVADAVAFLCSDDSRYINGTVIRVDGGYWLGL